MTQGPPVAEIGARAAADAGGVDVALLDDFLPVLVDAVASGRRLQRRDLARYRDAGRAAADRGVPPRALVDLYLSAAWRLWRHLPEVVAARDDPAAVVQAGEVMLRSVDDAVAVLIEGYQLARRDLVRSQVAARREFVDDLLIGGAQALPNLVQRAGLFGLSLVGPQAVIVVRAERDFTDSSPLTTLLERAIQGGSADADALVTTKDGLLVVVFAAPDRAAIDEVIAGLTGSLPSDPGEGVNLRRTAAVGSWRMGVGRAHQGPGGVRASYEQALEALELGAQLGGTAQVLDAADLLMHRVLVRDRAAMLELVETVLAPLVHARGGVEPMLQTLEAYFAAGGNASLAGRSLHLSVRALTYRLAKIAELTGRDPADPAQRFELQTAVTGARLLGWPDRA
ncbi:PucR family transcriptional regulator [Nakamurella deserti]|uniref:PucR family transcriptional regulator n=1 Tax=Nakamurella deserti TaxID=2164074 RepID=UPI000DBE17D3|nr:helix-turn-helix domain-containing protein [Nakamurella deserti]